MHEQVSKILGLSCSQLYPSKKQNELNYTEVENLFMVGCTGLGYAVTVFRGVRESSPT